MSDYQSPMTPGNQPPAQPTYTLPHSEAGNPGTKLAILFGAIVALIAANIYLFLQINNLQKEQAENQQQVMEELARLQENTTVTTAAAQRNLTTLKDELETARRQAQMAVGQAKVDATRHAEELARKLEQQQQAADQAMRSEISEVAASAATKIGEVSTEVSTVKTEVSATKSELQKTIESLRTVTGDLGVQSGLIATNSSELAALKALGERNYFEFRLAKTKQPQRVGDVLLQLKRSDQKRNRYTVDIIADDKRVEKKDKGLNEPVQFYTSKARLPYEIVVNEVGRDLIVGYLATPKVTLAR